MEMKNVITYNNSKTKLDNLKEWWNHHARLILLVFVLVPAAGFSLWMGLNVYQPTLWGGLKCYFPLFGMAMFMAVIISFEGKKWVDIVLPTVAGASCIAMIWLYAVTY